MAPRAGDRVRVLEISPDDKTPNHQVGDEFVVRYAASSWIWQPGYWHVNGQSEYDRGVGTVCRVEILERDGVPFAEWLRAHGKAPERHEDASASAEAPSAAPASENASTGQPGATAAVGIKHDDGKLPTHLLPPEIFLHSSFKARRPHEHALVALASWWRRVPRKGNDGPLESAFAHMLEAVELAEGGAPGGRCGRALEAITRVLAFGARKYTARNWECGIAYSRCYGAVLRHVFAVARGEERDSETGEHHYTHAATEIMFLLTYELRGMGDRFDDRPPKPMRKDKPNENHSEEG